MEMERDEYNIENFQKAFLSITVIVVQKEMICSKYNNDSSLS